jgi:FdhD protein
MLTQPNLRWLTVHKVRGDETTREKDVLAVEEPLEIRIAETDLTGLQRPVRSIAITMRTPGEDFELAAGFLFTEGLLKRREDVAEIKYCEDSPSPPTPLPLGEGSRALSPLGRGSQTFNIVTVHLRPGVTVDAARVQRNFYTTSSCGVCGKASLDALEIQGCAPLERDTPKVGASVIRGLDATLRKQQALFAKTGGLHAAALFDLNGKLLSLHEDVGRHNALDKLIGARLLSHQLPLTNYLLMVSGRTSFEIMQKALMAGIPIVAAVGAPSSLAVEVAQAFNITLIGFLRGESFNVYVGESRVVS